MDRFPYKLRKNQKEILQIIQKNLAAGKDFVFESGTGSGKTICALFSTLDYALEHTKKVIYTTRTNAQQRQVIVELRAMRKKMNEDKEKIFGVGMQGRANMCILARNNPEISNGTAEELSKLCSNEKKKALSKKKEQGCIYFRNFREQTENVEKILQWARDTLPTTEEFIEHCEKNECCPYELNKELIEEASVVVVPYVYVFDPAIRVKLLDWLNVSEEDVILVIDEAHNLPDYLRDSFSAQLSMWMLTSCVNEAEHFGDPLLGRRRITVSAFCKLLMDIISDLRDTYVSGMLESHMHRPPTDKNDAFIPSHEVETEILSRLNITSKTLCDIIGDLFVYGEKIQEYRQKEGKLPRSYLHKLGVFLEFWTTVEMDQYVKLVVDDSNGKNPRIETYCLDPSVGTGILKEVHSSIHMSGTLKPLEEYRDSLGLPEDTELGVYPSPFPKENRRVFFIRDVTTKYDEIARDQSIVSRMEKYITDICNAFPKNTIVFFPSFNTMSLFRNRGICNTIQRCVYIEEQHMSQTDLMGIVADFKESSQGDAADGAALFSVMGGRISEGMDFPAEELEIAIIVGIPYPKPTARQRGLQHYYDLKFGKGWEYTVDAPTARKMLQSLGRLIRNETDRGVAVILDKRAPRFKQYISDLTESEHLLKDISRFINH